MSERPLRSTESLIEEIASSVILVDTEDREVFEKIAALWEELAQSLPKRTAKTVRERMERGKTLLGKIVDGSSEDAAADLGVLMGFVEDLQKKLRNKPEGKSAKSAAGEKSEEAEEEEKPAGAENDPAPEGGFVLPEWVDEAVFREFLSMQGHVLEEIEGHILQVEKFDKNAESAIRRLIHTMKGEAGMLGLTDLEKIAHAVEDFLDGPASVQERADRLFRVKDWVAEAVQSYAEMRLPEPNGSVFAEELLRPAGETRAETGDPYDEERPEEQSGDGDETAVEEASRAAEEEAPSAGEADTPKSAGAVPIERDEETISLLAEFIQESEEGLTAADGILMEVEQNGPDPESVNGLFRVFHTIKGVAGFLELGEMAELAHTTETLLNQVRQGERILEGAVLDLVFDSTALMRRMLTGVKEAIELGVGFSSEPGLAAQLEKLRALIDGKEVVEEALPAASCGQKLGEILSGSGAGPSSEDVERAAAAQRESGRKLGEELVAEGKAQAKDVSRALRAQKRACGSGGGSAPAGAKIRETVKVDLERVDSLVEMIGELVIVESMVVHAPEIMDLTAPRVRNYLGQLGKITRDLQDVGMRMRMVPVRGVFQKMARMVRDLSHKSGKDVRMIVNGEGTEMDRSMVEQINDPLVHMIRNSVDHGIERSEDRVAAGKSKTGTVTLSAYHEGGNIVIEIRDDGKGLDRERILAKAIKNGLVSESDQLSDSEILNLIWAPGFSTAEKVTEVSGRGVGMDVVRRNIESMRGRVTTQSVPGQGTTFKIMLPLTLAIIDGMLVACGEERYIIPTLSIVESVKPAPSMLNSITGKHEMINLRGEILPLLRVDRLFNLDGAVQDLNEGLVVVVESVGRKVGLFIDDVLTQQQVVIKSLGNGLGRTPYVSGAAILSDGVVGLIVNVEEICGLLDRKSMRAPSGDREREAAAV
ncbi:MAG: chemotaxis protein CheA [Candidatus Eisenbacteria bacterium]|nr:chemotaxis protein CheA [Candidatus Eisenbacteria bacterium]